MEPHDSAATRAALVAGGTGLVGRALLPLLAAAPHYGVVHLLLRRPASGLPDSPKLRALTVDFTRLPVLPPVDDVYVALGTTIKVAGSREAFSAVDLDAVVATARAARTAGATRLAVVSAMGADKHSRVFYNRVKGQMEEAIVSLGFPSVVIAQPSFLVGDRAALGQPVRLGEMLAQRLLTWLPRHARPIEARRVAASLVDAMAQPASGTRFLRSGDMQPRSG